jgi:hypothetical protein
MSAIRPRDLTSSDLTSSDSVSSNAVSRRNASSPYIILTRPVCKACGSTMRLVRIDVHPVYLHSEVCCYDCTCGATQSNTADHRSVLAHVSATFFGEGQPSS